MCREQLNRSFLTGTILQCCSRETTVTVGIRRLDRRVVVSVSCEHGRCFDVNYLLGLINSTLCSLLLQKIRFMNN